MAKILLSISLVLLLLAAGLGFQTKQQVADKMAELSLTKSTLQTTQTDLEKKKTDLRKSEESLATANKSLEETKGQLATARTEADEAKSAAAKATTSLTEAQAKVTELETRIASMPASASPTDPGAGDAEKQALQTQLADAQAKLQEAVVARDAFQQRQKVAEENLTAAQTQLRNYQDPIQRQSVSGRVMNVNNGWNFVVLDIGDKQGVKVNTPLLVMRGGQMVARLKVTSVEPRTSIADVVGGTMPKGQTVQPGDRVVFAGNRATPNAPAPAPGTPDSGSAPLPAGASAQAQ